MTSSRRSFLALTAVAGATGAAAILQGAAMSHRERVDAALRGAAVDRTPYTFWYHFLDEKLPGEKHAEATLSFHRRFQTDLVKVMSDYPFPAPPAGAKWYEVRETQNPFPAQIVALQKIRTGLGGDAGTRTRFVETLFNPYNVAEKLSSKEEVARLKKENPQALLTALEAIARSEAHHARKALAAGASGIFLAIANAQPEVMTPAEYRKFSEPFDRMVVDAAAGAPLNILHLHGDHVWVEQFAAERWPNVAGINYSLHGTGVPLAKVRARYRGLLMGGIDERTFRTLPPEQVAAQAKEAGRAAGAKFLLAGGCSVPNETTDGEMKAGLSGLGVKL